MLSASPPELSASGPKLNMPMGPPSSSASSVEALESSVIGPSLKIPTVPLSSSGSGVLVEVELLLLVGELVVLSGWVNSDGALLEVVGSELDDIEVAGPLLVSTSKSVELIRVVVLSELLDENVDTTVVPLPEIVLV